MLTRAFVSLGALVGTSIAAVAVRATKPAPSPARTAPSHPQRPHAGDPTVDGAVSTMASAGTGATVDASAVHGDHAAAGPPSIDPGAAARPTRMAVPTRSAGIARVNLAVGPANAGEASPDTPVAVVARPAPVPSSSAPRRNPWRDASTVLTVLGAALVLVLSASYATARVVAPGATPSSAQRSADGDGPSLVTVPAVGEVKGSRTEAPLELGSPPSSPAMLPAAAPTLPAAVIPSLAPEPTPVPQAARAAAAATPRPAIDRRDFLKRCPGQPRCYVYTVQRGDNLKGIAHWWGISVARILELNPQISDPRRIYKGNRIVLPPPGR